MNDEEQIKKLAAVWLAAIMAVMLVVPAAAPVDCYITKQPTSDDPSVGVNDETNVSYQWYKKGGAYEITDKDELFLSSDSNSYDDKFGCRQMEVNSGIVTACFSLDNLKANDQLTVILRNADGIDPIDFSIEPWLNNVCNGVNSPQVMIVKNIKRQFLLTVI